MAMPLDESSMAAGVLMGSGLRELSQVLGLSKKKSGGMSPDGAQPSAANMAQGQIGEIDKILMLAKMQGQAPGAPQPGGPMPGGPPMPGMMPPGMMPPGAGPMPPAPSPPIAPPTTPGGLAAPLPQPGAPLPPGMAPPTAMPPGGAPPNPMMAALGGAAPGQGMGGGPLPMALLLQLLQGSQGLV